MLPENFAPFNHPDETFRRYAAATIAAGILFRAGVVFSDTLAREMWG